MLTPDDEPKTRNIYNRDKTQNIYLFYFVKSTLTSHLLFIKNVSP